MRLIILIFIAALGISPLAYSKEKSPSKELARKPASGVFACMVYGTIDYYSEADLAKSASRISDSCDINKPFSLVNKDERGNLFLCCTAR